MEIRDWAVQGWGIGVQGALGVGCMKIENWGAQSLGCTELGVGVYRAGGIGVQRHWQPHTILGGRRC